MAAQGSCSCGEEKKGIFFVTYGACDAPAPYPNPKAVGENEAIRLYRMHDAIYGGEDREKVSTPATPCRIPTIAAIPTPCPTPRPIHTLNRWS